MDSGRLYNSRVRIYNWFEQREMEEIQQRALLNGVDAGVFAVSVGQRKREVNLKPATNLTVASEDGYVRFGDVVMIYNVQTEGFLATNLADKLSYTDNKFAVTTSWINCPCVRNTFVIKRYEKEAQDLLPVRSKDGVLLYGQKFHIASNPELESPSPLYLQSERVSTTSSAKYSKHQEVKMIDRPAWETVWEVVYLDPTYRMEAEGQPVKINTPVILRHCGTGIPMASDKITYRNDFGAEYEAHAHLHLDSHRAEKPQNQFVFAMGDPPAKIKSGAKMFLSVVSLSAPSKSGLGYRFLRGMMNVFQTRSNDECIESYRERKRARVDGWEKDLKKILEDEDRIFKELNQQGLFQNDMKR